MKKHKNPTFVIVAQKGHRKHGRKIINKTYQKNYKQETKVGVEFIVTVIVYTHCQGRRAGSQRRRTSRGAPQSNGVGALDPK